MILARCSAAGAYDARLALQSIFSRPLCQYISNERRTPDRGLRRHTQQPHHVRVTTRRSYSSVDQSSTTRKTAAATDDDTARKAQSEPREPDILSVHAERRDEYQDDDTALQGQSDGLNKFASDLYRPELRDENETDQIAPNDGMDEWIRNSRMDLFERALGPYKPQNDHKDDRTASKDNTAQRVRRERLNVFDEMIDNHELHNDHKDHKDHEFEATLQKTLDGSNISKLPPDHDWKRHMLHLSRYIRQNKNVAFKSELPQMLDPRKDDINQYRMPLDYAGLCIPIETKREDKSQPLPWAQSIEQRRAASASQVLDREIEQFAQNLKQTPNERAVRKMIFEMLEGYARDIYSADDAKIAWYGSSSTGLVQPTSDIDIGIYCNSKRFQLPNRLKHLYNVLQGPKGSMRFTATAYRDNGFPILVTTHVASGIEVQIMEKLRTSNQDHSVRKRIKDMPNLQALYRVMRTTLGLRGLVGPFGGGISSYGLFMMLVGALALRDTPADVHMSLSSQLLHILNFWSDFDTTKFGISIGPGLEPAEVFEKTPFETVKDLTGFVDWTQVDNCRRLGYMRVAGQHVMGVVRPRQPYLLCLQDPANHWNDLGSNCHSIKHIQTTLRHLRNQLRLSMQHHDRLRDQSQALKKLGIERPDEMPEGETSLLLPLVGRCHEVYSQRRWMMKNFLARPRDIVRKVASAERKKKAPKQTPKKASADSEHRQS